MKDEELEELGTHVQKNSLCALGQTAANPIISKTLSKLIPILSDILELRRLDADSGDTAAMYNLFVYYDEHEQRAEAEKWLYKCAI